MKLGAVGARSVLDKMLGAENQGCMVVLAVTANKQKLPTLAIFIREKFSKVSPSRCTRRGA